MMVLLSGFEFIKPKLNSTIAPDRNGEHHEYQTTTAQAVPSLTRQHPIESHRFPFPIHFHTFVGRLFSTFIQRNLFGGLRQPSS